MLHQNVKKEKGIKPCCWKNVSKAEDILKYFYGIQSLVEKYISEIDKTTKVKY